MRDSSKRFTLRQHGLKGKLGGVAIMKCRRLSVMGIYAMANRLGVALLLTVLSAALIVAPPFTPGAWAQDTEGDIRLANGRQAHEGRVEIYHDGEWGSVCNDIWDETAHSDPRESRESRVVCRQLGYAGGGVSSQNFGLGSGPIWLDEVACTGYENRLEDCHSSGWGEHDCKPREDIGVVCSTATPSPGVLVRPSQSLQMKEGERIIYEISLESEPTGDVTITPMATGDVTVSGPTGAFNASNWLGWKPVYVTATEDQTIANKRATITHSVTGGGYDGVAGPSVSILILDPPQVEVSFVPGSYTVQEGGTTTVQVRLSTDPERTVTIPLTTTNGGGATAADYELPSSVTFNTGETEKDITVTATDDTIHDDGESVRLGFGSMLPDRVGIDTLGSTVTVAILDDDVPQVRVSFERTRYTAIEGGTAATVTVTLDTNPKRTVTIPLTTTNRGGATAADYELPSSVTFNTGETEKDITVTATDDTIDDDGESVRLRFGSSLPDRVGIDTLGSTAIVGILDNDVPQVRVSFARPHYTATEGGRAATVRVTLDTYPERTVTIPLTTTNRGGATAADYDALPSSVTFNTSETKKDIIVTATDDTIDDDGESVQLGFGSSLPDRVTAGSTTTVTLADNDTRGVKVSEPTLNVSEGDNQTYTLILTSEPTADVTVTVTGATGDVSLSGSPVRFTPTTWDRSRTITVNAAEDADAVADPTVTLRHTVSGGDYNSVSADVVRVTIIEKDAPTLTIERAQAAESAEAMVFMVELSVASNEAVTVDYATADGTATARQDYDSQSGTLTFPANSTTPQMIRVRLLNDTVDEAEEETFTVQLRNARSAALAGGGPTLPATGTITDDDEPVVAVSFKAASYTVDEDKAVEVTLRLSADPERQVEIPLTRTLGDNVESSDYSGVPDTVVFEIGDRERSFSFMALADKEEEAAETVTLAVGVPLPTRVEVGSPATTVVTIINGSGGDGGGSGGGGGDGGGDGGGGGSGGGPACEEDLHGNSAAQATGMALATETVGAICPAADVDYFTVPAPGLGLLFVDTTGQVQTHGSLWQAGATLAAGPTGGGQPGARLGARVEAGPVVIALQGQGGATGAYTLQVTFVPGFLENPGANSFQSGIGLISGWTCDADEVEIVLNGEPQEAAYGTARLDTEAVCGDTDNGFGLLFNWNLLGDGEHEVVALVDGVELDRATVTVTTLGAEFLRDVTGRCTATDFPTGDETVTLAWQQTQQNFVIAEGAAPTGANRVGTPGVGYLENPGPNSFQSGIGVLSGWACEGTEVVIELNGEPQPAAYGTERLDTLEMCGDTANGFGLLFNWNLLGEGAHEVVAVVDGEELGRATVRVTTLGVEFVRDVEGECVVEDFPMVGETTTLEWQQNSQNFVITDVE